MSRLTRKTNGKDYCLYCDCIEKENEIFEKSKEPLSPEEYYKEEPYTMEDSYYLEDAMNRLGKLEDIEEELGCSLEVVFKKVQELTIENWNQVHCLQYDYDEKLWYIISYSLWDDEFYPDRQYYLKDYKKTWWLKGEKYE